MEKEKPKHRNTSPIEPAKIETCAENIVVNITKKGIPLSELISKARLVYVPLCEPTLSSSFCNGISWSELLGKEERLHVIVGDIKCVPVYVSAEVRSDEKVSFRLTFPLEPETKRRIIISDLSKLTRARSDATKPSSGVANRRPSAFCFNNIQYDIPSLISGIEKMSGESLHQLKQNIVSALGCVINVDFIVTDTNNWCTLDRQGKELKYLGALTYIAMRIEKSNHGTKFYVLSEILMELKRLSSKNRGARLGQRLLSNDFMPRHIVMIPNPQDDIDSNIIADGIIGNHILALYKDNQDISVVSNDQQAMMLWQAKVDNNYSPALKYPKFLSLENLYQLLVLYTKILSNRSN